MAFNSLRQEPDDALRQLYARQWQIRISDKVATLPGWVRDYVVMHEICHLKEANHGRRFWALVNRYPLTERARGYLMALGMEESGR